jgi:hypothetical protein
MPMNPRLLVPRASGIASPLAISGCVGWYDSLDLTAMAQNTDGTGAVAVGDQVGYWKDKSATAAHVTQSNGANRPTLTSNQVNGRIALLFNGSNNTLLRSNYTAQSGLAGLTRVAVFSTSAASIMSRTLNVSTFAEAGGGTAFQAVSNRVDTSASAAIRGVARGGLPPAAVYTSVYDGAAGTLTVRFNNVEQSQTFTNGTAIPATTASGAATIHIGSNVGFNNFINGPIAEYLIYNRTLSAGELAAVYQYLRKKWGFA